jgi:two-component system LytT family response regulator
VSGARPPLRVLVADDEPLARRRLRDLLAAEDGVAVVAECANGVSALDAITSTRPDVALLDVRMPGRDGLALAERLRALGDDAPVVVFVTAHADHALRAFDVRAADYLLKPYGADRLRSALERARELLRARRADRLDALRATVRDELRELLADDRPAGRYPERFAVSVGQRTVFVRAATIDRVSAEGNYVRLHAGRQSFLLRTSMQDMERDLDPRHFARVHRSAIVRVDRVRELRSPPVGEAVLVLDDGSEVPISARYRRQFEGRA